MTTPADYLDFAYRTALAAGEVTLPHFRVPITVVDKGVGGYDPVTAADRDAEAVIRAEDVILSGRVDAALGAGTATRLHRALEVILGRMPSHVLGRGASADGVLAALSEAIAASRRVGWYRHVLKEKAGIALSLQDDYRTAVDRGLFAPMVRLEHFACATTRGGSSATASGAASPASRMAPGGPPWRRAARRRVKGSAACRTLSSRGHP